MQDVESYDPILNPVLNRYHHVVFMLVITVVYSWVIGYPMWRKSNDDATKQIQTRLIVAVKFFVCVLVCLVFFVLRFYRAALIAIRHHNFVFIDKNICVFLEVLVIQYIVKEF